MQVVDVQYFTDGDVDYIRETFDTGHIVIRPYPHKAVNLSYVDGVVTAEIIDRVNGGRLTSFSEVVPFVFEGEIVEVKANKGIASIEFEAEVSGQYEITTLLNPHRFENGVVTINV